jgi:hypothetical protein
VGAGTATAVLGTQITRAAVDPHAVSAASVARDTLAFTGVAVGLYVAVALALLVVGFVLHRAGTVRG